MPNIAASRDITPEHLKRALTGDLDWIVMKALEKDRSRRYETANGFAADVLRHLAYEPVVAAPPSRAYRLRKFVRKNRGTVIAASLVLFALLAGIVGTSLGLIAADARRREAEGARQTALAALAETDAARDAAQREVVKFDITTAAQQAERSEPELALHWVARAWHDDQARLKPGQRLDPGAEANHRLRLAAAIDRLPQLVGFCPHDKPVADADCDPNRRPGGHGRRYPHPGQEGGRVLGRGTRARCPGLDRRPGRTGLPAAGPRRPGHVGRLLGRRQPASPPRRRTEPPGCGRRRPAKGCTPSGRGGPSPEWRSARTGRRWPRPSGRPCIGGTRPPASQPARRSRSAARRITSPTAPRGANWLP